MHLDTASNFIKSALTTTETDLYAYEDDKFCAELQLAALDAVIFSLLTIKHMRARAKEKNSVFDLSQALNNTHPQTGLTILDYCLVSGLDQLALEAAFCGAKTRDLIFFQHRLALHFNPEIECPQIVLNINQVINQLGLKNRQISSRFLPTTAEPSTWQQVKSFCADHKYPAILLSTGILGVSGGIIAYPFLHGVASALLLSVGVPSLLSSVNSLQSSNGGKDRLKQSEMRDRSSSDANDLHELTTIAFEAKKTLQMRLLRGGILAGGLAQKQHLLTAPQSPTMLFDFNKTVDAHKTTKPSLIREGFKI